MLQSVCVVVNIMLCDGMKIVGLSISVPQVSAADVVQSCHSGIINVRKWDLPCVKVLYRQEIGCRGNIHELIMGKMPFKLMQQSK